MTTVNFSIRVSEDERKFADRVAAHYGIVRRDVIYAFYQAGKREFLARLRARALVNRLKESEANGEITRISQPD